MFLKLRCPDCGNEISDADAVCPHCGADLNAPLDMTQRSSLAAPYLEKARKELEGGRNLKRALDDCDQALEFTPESAEAHSLRGLILDTLGQTDEAILAYREAVRLDPDSAEAKENLAGAEAEYQQGRPAGAGGPPGAKEQGCLKRLLVAVLAVIVLCVIGAVGAGLYFVARPFLVPKQTIVFEPDRSRISQVNPEDLKRTAEILAQRWQDLGYGYPSASFVVSDQGQIIGRVPAGVESAFIDATKAQGLVEFVDFGHAACSEGETVSTDFAAGQPASEAGAQRHTILTGSDLKSAGVSRSTTTGQFMISFTFGEDGTKTLADYTSKNVGSILGIVVDKVVISCPRVNSAILNGNGVIEGSFTRDQANRLAVLMRTSALPVPLK